jgi:hypothetical protein
MKYKDRISERDSFASGPTNTFRTQLWQLKSLETATKKRRARKKKAANNSELTKSTMKPSG